MDIPINYIDKPRTELVSTYSYAQKFYSFPRKEEAEEYIKAYGGVLIHAVEGDWQVWPMEIKGKIVVATYEESIK